MQIGEVIRTYRKRGNMTQEELAGRLGVTAPAVNKWENGNSLPDITLLAPIARLLGVSLDELLAFQDELTVAEIRDLTEELSRMLKDGDYEEAFQWAKKQMETYPNCEKLIYQLALVLESWQVMQRTPEADKYEEYILRCYSRLLGSKDEVIRRSTADAMFHYHLRKEEYEKAECYLEHFSDQGSEKKRKQAMIYSKTGRSEEAYRCYEELLFAEYQTLSAVFHGIYMLAMQEDNLKKAYQLADKQSELARIFEMGEYNEAAGYLELAIEEKDVDRTIHIIEKLLESIDSIGSFCTSSLYEHMTFKEFKKGTVKELRQNLLQEFLENEAYEFVRKDPHWKELMERDF